MPFVAGRGKRMGILKRFIDLLGRPRGIFGPVLLSMMNVGHQPFIEKGERK